MEWRFQRRVRNELKSVRNAVLYKPRLNGSDLQFQQKAARSDLNAPLFVGKITT